MTINAISGNANAVIAGATGGKILSRSMVAGTWSAHTVPTASGYISFDAVLLDGTTAYVAGSQNHIHRFDALTTTGFVREVVSVASHHAALWFGGGKRYLLGNRMYEYKSASNAWIYKLDTPTKHVAIWGDSLSNLYAANTGGRVEHWNGYTWSTYGSLPTDCGAVHGIWGDGTTGALYAVGVYKTTGGVLLSWSGTGWSVARVMPSRLWSIHGREGGDVYAVGDDGQVLSKTPTGPWTTRTLPADLKVVSYRTVWVAADDDVYIGGDDGTIGHYARP